MVSERTPVCGEFPETWPFERVQEVFLRGFLVQCFKDTDFSELADEESSSFNIASMGLAIDFRARQDRKIEDLWRGGRTRDANLIRGLWMEDVVHCAHNEILEWEKVSRRCKEGSDKYIEANSEAYEWLKVARLAEHDVHGSLSLALPRENASRWPV